MKPLILVLSLAPLVSHGALTDGLAAYWDFEGTVANHASASGGGAFDGTLMGNAATTGTPRAGTGALALDGAGDYLDVTSLIPLNAPWSVAAWYRTDVAYSGTARGFVFETSGGYPISYGLREGATTAETAHQAYTSLLPASGPNQSVQIADAATVNTWHHILLVFTPATASQAGAITGYLDGSAQFNLTVPAGSTLAPADGFHIGTYRDASDRWFGGSIDEIAMWGRALSPMEIMELHQRGLAGISIVTPLAEVGKKFVGVSSATPGMGTVSGSGIHDANAGVPIVATPATGYGFTAWSGDFAGQPGSFTYTGTTDARATATFAPVQGAPRWWKGNLHTHSFWSDGNGFPEMVADWYKNAGYHFLGFSEHNLLQTGDKWKTVASVDTSAGTTAFDAYMQRFGDEWVETRNDDTPATREVRLKRLAEYRPMFDEAERFLMIEAEEITLSSGNGKAIHMNVINLPEVVSPITGATVRETISQNHAASIAAAARTGRQMLFTTNHPNYIWGVTAEDLAAVPQSRFFEIWNGVVGDNDPGDATHPSTDQIWDIANTLRMVGSGAHPLFAQGTDDAHDYHQKSTTHWPGRAWIMVRSTSLTAEGLLQAIDAGDFYASTGVELNDVNFDRVAKRLSLAIKPQAGQTFTTRFIGTRRGANITGKPRLDGSGNPVATTLDYSTATGPQIGEVLAQSTDLNPSYVFQGNELYVRAVVTSSAAPAVPGEAVYQQAWTQPAYIRDETDADGDGVTGYQESWMHGTDPNLADTDGDGLPDGFEILQAHTDPLSSNKTAVGYIQRNLCPVTVPLAWRDSVSNTVTLRMGIEESGDLSGTWQSVTPTGAGKTTQSVEIPVSGTGAAKRFFRATAASTP
ncbi:MAG: hypothetical protein J0M04_03415 [Verrucomicrobia bacterium]|nr:hypothetical protein [Verrucomicrobiota bacterium]